MGKGRLKRYDTRINGFIAGILLPLGVFVLVYLFRYREVSFSEYLQNLVQLRILIKMVSLCGFFNLFLFIYFYHRKFDRLATGIIAASFLFAFLVLLSRIF